MINKEELDKRLSELEENKESFLRQAQSALQVIEGRIQEIKDLIRKEDKNAEADAS